jgi:hypothetical protein
MGIYGAVVRQWLDREVQPRRTSLIGIEGLPRARRSKVRLHMSVQLTDGLISVFNEI